MLDMTHPGVETIMKRLPSIFEIGTTANVDITKESRSPVVPTIHYQMGGISDQHPRPGGDSGAASTTPWSTACTRVGECSCVSARRQPPGQ